EKLRRILKTALTVLVSAAIIIAIWFVAARERIKPLEPSDKIRNGAAQKTGDVNDDFEHKDIQFERISTEQGLSLNSIFCSLQDRQGFIWFGTMDGLDRYNGYDFVAFRHSQQDDRSISDNFVTALFEDSDGRLWVGTGNGGLNRFDSTTRTFKHYRRDENNPNGLAIDCITAICSAGNGK